MKRPTRSFPPANLQTDIINSDLLFFEKKSRQKKLQLSGSLCRLHIFNKGAVFPLLFDLRCVFPKRKAGKRNFSYRGSLCRLHIFNKEAVFPLLFDLRCIFPKRKAGKRNFSYRGACADFIFSIKGWFFRSNQKSVSQRKRFFNFIPFAERLQGLSLKRFLRGTVRQ